MVSVPFSGLGQPLDGSLEGVPLRLGHQLERPPQLVDGQGLVRILHGLEDFIVGRASSASTASSSSSTARWCGRRRVRPAQNRHGRQVVDEQAVDLEEQVVGSRRVVALDESEHVLAFQLLHLEHAPGRPHDAGGVAGDTAVFRTIFDAGLAPVGDQDWGGASADERVKGSPYLRSDGR